MDPERLRGNAAPRKISWSVSLKRNLPVSNSFCTASSTRFAFTIASEVDKCEESSLSKWEETSPDTAPFDFALPFEAAASGDENNDDMEEEVGTGN